MEEIDKKIKYLFRELYKEFFTSYSESYLLTSNIDPEDHKYYFEKLPVISIL
jgi:hypothetical protein